jgi:hypothetical protein
MKQLVLACAVGALVVSSTGASAQSAPEAGTALGTVTISRAVMADGQRLAAGSYEVRLTADAPEPAAGQTPGAERFVEFVRDGNVMGREVATVVLPADVQEVLEGRGPGLGSSLVDTLSGGEYLRVWLNHGGTHYIVHLPPA